MAREPTRSQPSGRKENVNENVNSEKLRKRPTFKSRRRAAQKEKRSLKKLQAAVSIPASRRSSRVSEYTRLKILAADQDYAFGAMDCESSAPTSWKEAIKDSNWMNSMELEFQQLQDLHSWEYKKPDNRKLILRSHCL